MNLDYDSISPITGNKCVLEEALKPLPREQKKIIANLIAKTYTMDN